MMAISFLVFASQQQQQKKMRWEKEKFIYDIYILHERERKKRMEILAVALINVGKLIF